MRQDLSFEDFLMALLGPDEDDRAQLHAHRCGQCRHVWEHTGDNAGSEQAHHCPSCKAGPFWDRFDGRRK